MLSVDDARSIAARWREQFVSPESFEQSWTRFFEMVGDPDVGKLERWLAKDHAKDAVKHAGIVSEPLLPTRQRWSASDCRHCDGKRYVRQDVTIDHPNFGKAHPCPACNR